MQVEVDEADAAAEALLEPRERAELDRAVAAEHERHVAVGRGDPLGGLEGDVAHGLHVLGERVLAVGEPPPELRVADIPYLETASLQRGDQPGPAECGGGTFLAGGERPHAARHTDHIDRAHRRSLPLRGTSDRVTPDDVTCQMDTLVRRTTCPSTSSTRVADDGHRPGGARDRGR